MIDGYESRRENLIKFYDLYRSWKGMARIMKVQIGLWKAAVIGSVGSLGLGVYWTKSRKEKKIQELQNRIHVLSDHFQLLNHWMELRNERKSVVSYFEEMGYQHIGIYGMAELANRLVEELTDSPVCVDYGIDRDVACTISRMEDVYSLEDELPDTDVIDVTPYASFKEIKEILEEKVSCPIVSLEEVVWSV